MIRKGEPPVQHNSKFWSHWCEGIEMPMSRFNSDYCPFCAMLSPNTQYSLSQSVISEIGIDVADKMIFEQGE